MPLLTFQTTILNAEVLKAAPTKDSPKPPPVGQPLPKWHEFTSDPGRLKLFGLMKYIPYDYTHEGIRYEGWLRKSTCEEVKQTGGASTGSGGGGVPAAAATPAATPIATFGASTDAPVGGAPTSDDASATRELDGRASADAPVVRTPASDGASGERGGALASLLGGALDGGDKSSKPVCALAPAGVYDDDDDDDDNDDDDDDDDDDESQPAFDPDNPPDGLVSELTEGDQKLAWRGLVALRGGGDVPYAHANGSRVQFLVAKYGRRGFEPSASDVTTVMRDFNKKKPITSPPSVSLSGRRARTSTN